MKVGKRPLGYTIIEVLIVLAVSGVMFIIAATFISGKEARTAFSQGTNEFVARVQTVIAEVVNGQFSDVSLTCTVGATLSFGTGGSQGTNAPCEFVGKFLHFSVNQNLNSYEIFSLVAARNAKTLTGPPAVTPVAPPFLTGGNSGDLTSLQAIPQSLTLSGPAPIKVIDASGIAHSAYGFGFVQSLGTQSPTGGFNSGGQTVGMIYSAGLGSNNLSESGAAGALTGTLAPAKSATICLTDGARYAQVLVGSNANQLTVSLKVVSTPC